MKDPLLPVSEVLKVTAYVAFWTVIFAGSLLLIGYVQANGDRIDVMFNHVMK